MDLRDKILFKPPEIGCVLSLTGLPGGGSTIYDKSPYGNMGTITGATWVRLPSGLWCLSFDGVDDWVNCGNKASLDITDKITIEAWINPSSFASLAKIVDRDQAFGFAVQTSGKIAFYYMHAGGWSSLTSDKALSQSMWSYVVATQEADGSNTLIKLYDNGELDKSGTTTGRPTPQPTQDTAVGAYSVGNQQWFNGSIALARVHNRVLSALEIQNHFNREKHLFGVW